MAMVMDAERCLTPSLITFRWMVTVTTMWEVGRICTPGRQLVRTIRSLHIVAEQPGARYPSNDPELADAPPLQVQPPQPEQSTAHEAKPNEPSVLVFRDGHQQEVSNYAIMGQTVYVFDKRTQKIALADLDVPATIKANDDRGLEFKIPPQKPAPKNSDLQQKSAPDQSPTAPSKIAMATP